MRLFIDLHIHTALSPCGDDDMTPNNIINMAKIKGLHAIAITDHNTSGNAASCMRSGKKAGLTVIPGMELQTREDIHVVCLFRDICSCFEFEKYVYNNLPSYKNREDLFGKQVLFDENDNITGYVERMLLTSSNISFDDAFKKAVSLRGAFIPAHIERDSFSIFSNLGFIPDYIPLKTLEYHSYDKLQALINSGLLKKSYNFIRSSDAHYLYDISECEFSIECPDSSIDSIIDYLAGSC